MNILINFGTLKKGGGQTVALNFISSLIKLNSDRKFHFAIVKNTQIHKFFIRNKIDNYYLVPRNPLIRMLFELIYGRFKIYKFKIDIIYSYFGIGLYQKKIPQITGSADSNIYFPEINFWSQYKGIKLIFKKIIDNYRIFGLKRSFGIIFENEELEKRCHNLFKLKETKFISPSIFVDESNHEVFTFDAKITNDVQCGLFLCGWQLNKNIMKIPEIAKLLKRKKIKFHFILTAPKDNSYIHLKFIKILKKYNVEDMVSIVGQVNKEKLNSLYNQVNFIFLLSKLESFSNNIIESWFFNKCLIVADEPWARSICKNGAVYVDRESSVDIVEKIIYIYNNLDYKSKILSNAKKNLNTYPSIKERTIQELNYIKYIYEKN